MTEHDLRSLRAQLADLDSQIIHLAAQRRALSIEIGKIKQTMERPSRDFAQESAVLKRANQVGSSLGLSSKFTEELILHLIRSSLTVQERDRVATRQLGAESRALIIGGSGRMGTWFAHFLESAGFDIVIADPNTPPDGLPHITDWRDIPLDMELIIVAAPIRTSAKILSDLALRKPSGCVVDISSVKTPLKPGFDALRAAGVAVASIHPMFGPDVALLSGRHVMVIDLGSSEATDLVCTLFEPTMAKLVPVELDEHDRLMAQVLGLSHALNIAFFTALKQGGQDATNLSRLSSSTFDAQLGIAAGVSAENPHLYFEIQALNAYGPSAIQALNDAVAKIRECIESQDETTFVEIMAAGHSYLQALQSQP
ncbi:MAG: hypothetical protein CMH54_13565 [Myxococcales bacterium]|nr:hypothetical protein [Myxococcales bacterium]